jgi:hypothetical protein
MEQREELIGLLLGELSLFGNELLHIGIKLLRREPLMLTLGVHGQDHEEL